MLGGENEGHEWHLRDLENIHEQDIMKACKQGHAAFSLLLRVYWQAEHVWQAEKRFLEFSSSSPIVSTDLIITMHKVRAPPSPSFSPLLFLPSFLPPPSNGEPMLRHGGSSSSLSCTKHWLLIRPFREWLENGGRKVWGSQPRHGEVSLPCLLLLQVFLETEEE